MAAKIVWLSYLGYSYLILPVVFRVRFARWPYAYACCRRDVYTLVDFLYAGVLGVYTLAWLYGADANPLSIPAGLAAIVAGCALQLWAVAAMGPSWRFGQDPDDKAVRFVFGGPFRFVRHPIYLSLIIIAAGQTLLAGLDWRTLLLITATLAHYVAQSRAETRHWNANMGVGKAE